MAYPCSPRRRRVCAYLSHCSEHNWCWESINMTVRWSQWAATVGEWSGVLAHWTTTTTIRQMTRVNCWSSVTWDLWVALLLTVIGTFQSLLNLANHIERYPYSPEDHKGQCWCLVSTIDSPHVLLVTNPPVGCHSFLPGHGYLHGYIAHFDRPSTNFCCLVKRGTCVNNLPRVAAWEWNCKGLNRWPLDR